MMYFGFILETQVCFNIQNSIMQFIKSRAYKRKDHIIHSIDTENSLDQIKHPFMIKNAQQAKKRRKLLETKKDYQRKTYC